MRAPETLAAAGGGVAVRPLTARLPHPAARWITPLSLLAADLAAVAAAATAAVLAWRGAGHPLDPGFYAAQWPLLSIFPAAYAADGLYSALALHPAEELRRLSRATTLVWLAFASMTFLAKEGTAYSRGVFLLAWLGCLAAVPALRALVRHGCGGRRWWGQAAVLVGEGAAVDLLSERLRSKPSLGLKPVGVAADVAEAREYRRRGGVRCAILTGPSSGAAVFALQQVFSRVIVAPEVAGGLPSLRVESADLHGVLGLEMSHRLLRPAPVWLKALSDLAMSAVVSALALPLASAIAVAVKLESRGPVFYGHRRRGLGGREFRAWKFRTMVTDADAALARHLSDSEEARAEWAATRKLAHDPRVTRVGRWLRRWSLDELPQLWNVLRGEMSLVGPRPIVEEEVARYGPGYVFYERVRPGLTGLWQVSGRNRLPYEERVKLDLYYVSNWSLWLDLYILARTVRAVSQGEGW